MTTMITREASFALNIKWIQWIYCALCTKKELVFVMKIDKHLVYKAKLDIFMAHRDSYFCKAKTLKITITRTVKD